MPEFEGTVSIITSYLTEFNHIAGNSKNIHSTAQEHMYSVFSIFTMINL